MKIEIENILGHGFFECEFEPGVTVVTGDNASGKTSVMLCLAALAAHNPNPANISGTAKKNYIRDGSKTGEARMNGRVWEPGKEVATPIDAAPMACPEAVGIYDFARTRPKAERSLPYAQLEGEAKTPHDMLKGTWPHNAIKLEAVCGTIKRLGWDRAHTVFTEQLRDAKRKWSDVTGAGTYGINKAAKWLPDGWSAEIVGMGEERARSVESDARDRLQGLETSAAVAADRRKRREEAQARIPDLEEKLRVIEAELGRATEMRKEAEAGDMSAEYDEAETQWRELMAERNGQPKPIGECPDCGSVLTNGKGGKLVNMAQFKVAEDIDERIAEAKDRYEAATHAHNEGLRESIDCERKENNLVRSHSQANAQLESCKREAELENVEMVSPEAVEAARDAFHEASKNVGIVTQMVAAARAASAVAELAIVVAQLAPSGVRAGGMGGVLERVNNGLKKIKQITGWGLVSVGKDFSVTYEGRPPELIAASERARINYSMATAFALMTKSGFLTFEGVDILHGDTLSGLWGLIGVLKVQNADRRIVVDGTDIANPMSIAANVVKVN